MVYLKFVYIQQVYRFHFTKLTTPRYIMKILQHEKIGNSQNDKNLKKNYNKLSVSFMNSFTP